MVGVEVHVVDEQVAHRGVGVGMGGHLPAVSTPWGCPVGGSCVVFPLTLCLRPRHPLSRPSLTPNILERRERMHLIQGLASVEQSSVLTDDGRTVLVIGKGSR